MKTRPRHVVLVAITVAAFALPFLACSFPDVTFGVDGLPGEGGLGGETSGEGGGADARQQGDSASEASLDAAIFDARIDGQDPDGAITGDAGTVYDAAGCAPGSCDCDHDTYNDLGKAGCENAPGPTDCDDSRDAVHPDADYLATPNPPRNGDVNCVNGVEKFYPTKVSCGLLGIGACAGIQGFTGDPACGASGEYIFCAVQNGIFCGVGSTTSRVQACK